MENILFQLLILTHVEQFKQVYLASLSSNLLYQEILNHSWIVKLNVYPALISNCIIVIYQTLAAQKPTCTNVSSLLVKCFIKKTFCNLFIKTISPKNSCHIISL